MSLLDSLNIYCIHKVDQDSVDGIATRYGRYGPGIESQWRRDFPHPSRPVLRPSSFLCNAYWVFLRAKLAGAWRRPPALFSFEVKERVELHLYFPSGPSWHLLGWTLSYCIHKDFKHMKNTTHTHSTIWNCYLKAVKFTRTVTLKELL